MISYSNYGANQPCTSNDARDDFSLQPCTYHISQTIFISCLASNEDELVASMDAAAITYEFDYEIHTPYNDPSADLLMAVDVFQNDLAGGIAEKYGVVECQSWEERRRQQRHRDLGKVTYTDDWVEGEGREDQPVCLGVSSSPSDTPDNMITKCIIPVDLEQPSTCTPMIGYITLYSRPSDRRQLTEQQTLVDIQNYIETSTTYLSDDLLAVSYIGIRDVVPVGIVNPNLLSRPGDRLLNFSGDHFSNDAVSAVPLKRTLVGIVCATLALSLIRKSRKMRVAALSSNEVH